MAASPTVLVVGPLDSKFDEIQFLRSQILTLSNNACKVKLLNVSTTNNPASVFHDASNPELSSPLIESDIDFGSLTEAESVEKGIEICSPAVTKLVSESKIQAAVALGGSTLLSLAPALLRRACPIGFPKLVISTIASGDVKPYIEESDITIMHSILEVAGLNSLTKKILTNAAGAVSGMALAQASLQKEIGDLKISENKKIAVTMLDTTTPCADNIRKILTTTPHDVSSYEIYIFHAHGFGGKAVERLILEGQIDAVVDLTMTEIPNGMPGGGGVSASAEHHRLEVAARKGIPMIVSVGACDSADFGPKNTLSDSVRGRNLYELDPQHTLVRTNKGENIQMAKYITSKLKAHAAYPANVRVILPKGGISSLDQAQVEKPTTSSAPPAAQTKPRSDSVIGTIRKPWHDAEADAALFETIIDELDGSKIEVFEYLDNINDESFAISVCEHLLEVMGIDPREYRLANARRRKWSFTHGTTIDKLRRTNSIEIPDA